MRPMEPRKIEDDRCRTQQGTSKMAPIDCVLPLPAFDADCRRVDSERERAGETAAGDILRRGCSRWLRALALPEELRLGARG